MYILLLMFLKSHISHVNDVQFTYIDKLYIFQPIRNNICFRILVHGTLSWFCYQSSEGFLLVTGQNGYSQTQAKAMFSAIQISYIISSGDAFHVGSDVTTGFRKSSSEDEVSSTLYPFSLTSRFQVQKAVSLRIIRC